VAVLGLGASAAGTRAAPLAFCGDAWARVASAPFCVPAAPREVLVALRLRTLTPHGGCFAP
jgi:hypothetical protein